MDYIDLWSLNASVAPALSFSGFQHSLRRPCWRYGTWYHYYRTTFYSTLYLYDAVYSIHVTYDSYVILVPPVRRACTVCIVLCVPVVRGSSTTLLGVQVLVPGIVLVLYSVEERLLRFEVDTRQTTDRHRTMLALPVVGMVLGTTSWYSYSV